MSDLETQTSEYCTAPTTQNPSQPRPEAAEDDNILTAERGKPNSFGLFDDLPKNVILSKFLPACQVVSLMVFRLCAVMMMEWIWISAVTSSSCLGPARPRLVIANIEQAAVSRDMPRPPHTPAT